VGRVETQGRKRGEQEQAFVSSEWGKGESLVQALDLGNGAGGVYTDHSKKWGGVIFCEVQG